VAHGKDYVTPETDRGIASLKHQTTRRKQMALELYKNLLTMLVGKSSMKRNQDYMVYAKTEYGKDWQYAYHYMLDNQGKGPRTGIYI